MTPYYTDSACTIYHGDAREILSSLESMDLLLTDPPYGIAWNNTGYFKDSKIFSLGVSEWDEKPSKQTMDAILAAASNAVIWGGNYFADMLPAFKAPLVWDKQNGENRFADGELAWTSFQKGTLRIFRHTWWGFVKDSEQQEPMLYPTQKPIALMR